ncbi:hypothetical protein [Klebsiella pneumoniae]|uniref:hypothetical protein n=1 Tax=Klebsiella pneumoniae TaxID=573 RepID=UPI000E2DC7AA|nr:hypothetical protein [Klebsiella pneumoniae]KAA1693297.1 hypothetical protein F1D88_04495 [Klebsiella pneumoniae]MBK0497970.1 hypothetical protein [Klebsiella pneumoniae]MBK0550921.1 hypothetical protein [Klebsiella pneumoniae]MBV1964284.1 hypothetical protein [Klebsiella pneumoniae]MBV2004630.1 hypothetical protein [Klebsiella pneumoniae]
MSDITELAQSLKAAAVRVIKNYDSEWFEAGHQICTVHKSKINLISLANPVNVLALVEALEKAQQRISQLESRTVTVNLASRRLPSDYVDGEFGNDDLAAIHNACRLECKVSVEKYLSAHGIVVKWEAE